MNRKAEGPVAGEDGIVRDGLREGDLVLVTGAGGGFGRALCRRFGRLGAKVAAWEVDAENGAETVRQVEAEGGEATLFRVDLASPAAIETAVQATISTYGVPYCVINNAGIYPSGEVVELAPEVWEKTLAVNLTAPFLILHALGVRMLAQKRGVVINIASGRALEGSPKRVAYACSKAAIVSLTKTLAIEWAPHIRVNSIIPGVSMTSMPLQSMSREALLERSKTASPMGRIGYPEDIAGLAAFLASADAAYMTGQGLAMNGGRIMIP
jgi:2-hydroxycyclohexanecarboxyl-CoA dehydrogenase